MKLAYCSFNLFGYEHITPPPKNLPKEFITFYVTDSVENVNESEKLGWKHGVLFEKFKEETDKFKKRIDVSYLKIYFDEILPDIKNFLKINLSEKKDYLKFKNFTGIFNDKENFFHYNKSRF